MASIDMSRDGASDSARKANFDEEVADATLLLNFAVAQGISDANGRKVDDDLIDRIKRAQDLAGLSELPPAEARASFEKAYRDLARFLLPITVETLKATAETYGVRSLVLAPVWPRPISIIWSRKLSAWTLLFVAVALTGTWLDMVYGELPESIDLPPNDLPRFSQAMQIIFHILVPFTYGAIGACTALLKACQAYIHMRQFDPLRIPEYYNRMILGGVSGGIIVLLVQQIAGDNDTTIRFSAAALGFLAGYNNELLFGAIERISQAILPKIGISSVRQERPTQARGVHVEDISLKHLVERHSDATDPDDKKLYAALIQKVQDRL